MKYTEEQKNEMYLDWFYNYLSTQQFAIDYEITNERANEIISEGRLIHLQKYKG
jgi:hypothetical protein